jgi:hypothetical protein
VNSEIARANCISEIERPEAVKSPSSKPRAMALYYPSISSGMSNLMRRKIAVYAICCLGREHPQRANFN